MNREGEAGLREKNQTSWLEVFVNYPVSDDPKAVGKNCVAVFVYFCMCNKESDSIFEVC